MKMRYFLWFLLLLPFICFAQDATQTTLNFNPQEGDVSVVLLSNIFGVVGNLLFGSGTQIFGEIFRIFNAAVLTIGGILLFYILIVSTLNTSAEGEYLGRKWKSIWIPIRAVIGITLLIPQASGYCLAQIFVMWLVLQGVGAGNQVWNAALDYLARGGMIVARNIEITRAPTPEIPGTISEKTYKQNPANPSSEVEAVATTTDLAGQMLENAICLKYLEGGLDTINQLFSSLGGQTLGSTDLADTVNFQDIESVAISNKSTANRSVDIPNSDIWGIPGTSGLCGTITWAPIDVESSKLLKLSQAAKDATQLSRAKALAAMFRQSRITASTIVNNFNKTPPQSLGHWDGDNWVQEGAGLNGFEIRAASLVYLAEMRATYNLISEKAQNIDFIKNAKQDGWIMAGRYFSDVAQINREVTSYISEKGKVTISFDPAKKIEAIKGYLISIAKNEGISPDSFAGDITKISNFESSIESTAGVNDYKTACSDLSTPFKQIYCYIISAKNYIAVRNNVGAGPKINTFKFTYGPIKTIQYGDCSWYDVPCRINNFGISAANSIIIFFSDGFKKLLDLIFGGIGGLFGDLFNVIYSLFNQPGNPIITLSSAGSTVINTAGQMWAGGAIAAAILGLIPTGAVTTLITFIMPLYTAILFTLFAIGIVLAYYIPLVPYIMFTFASIGWIIAVIESMVAAPIVALGIAHPENHEVFGKAEQAVMLLLNVFLRPAMTIIGFVAAIILSYISIWFLNEGFIRASEGVLTNLTGMASMFAPLAAIAIYVTILMTIVQKSFSLIYNLPDKILRWLSGGMQASFGEEAAGMIGEVKQAVSGGAQTAAKPVSEVAGKTIESAAAKGEKKEGADQKTGGGEPGGSSIQQAASGPAGTAAEAAVGAPPGSAETAAKVL